MMSIHMHLSVCSDPHEHIRTSNQQTKLPVNVKCLLKEHPYSPSDMDEDLISSFTNG